MATIVNRTVQEGGREYRVAFYGTRPIAVMLKPKRLGGRERAIEISGLRGLALVRLARAQGGET